MFIKNGDPTMKHVLHVLYSLERSGMEMMLLNSNAEWRRRGYQCDVLATADAVGPLAEQMRACGYVVHHIPFRSRLSLLPRLDFVRSFFRLCKSGYDIVHIHSEGGAPLFAVLAKLAGVERIAVTPHGTFRFRGFLRFRKLCERYFVRMLSGRYGMISEGVSACEWERFRNKGVSIRNWFNDSHFKLPVPLERGAARQRLGTRPESFVIVSVGNCSAIKNHEAILSAIPLLPDSLQPLYVHIGREEPSHPEQRLAERLGIQDRVRFLGSQAEVLPYLWAADVFLMPSLHEGLGVAAIEAIASGLPLICSKVDGLSDIAEATEHTVLTETTPKSIAEAILWIAALPFAERRNRALQDGRLVRERFSIRSGVQSIISGLYAEDPRSELVSEQLWGQS
jgi:glycosyltransferase involved in cell wall biosynthesis